jgi:acetyltransferase-like isoleucine patch superfamily enzyme
VTERRPGALRFLLGPGADVTIGPGVWLRTDLGPVILACFENARMVLGPEAFLNGAHLSAKRELVLGRRAWVGPGSRVFDSDQHDFDDARPEEYAPVRIGDHVWVASDCTVLKGVTIGEHAVVGARSLVTRDVAPHALVFGTPAVPRGTVGDRSRVR